MADFEVVDGVLMKYRGNAKEVVIPSGVTGIGDCAFQNHECLKKVSIPDSVTSIGGWAFSGCRSLKGISIPDSVTYIAGGAFYGAALDFVRIPKSIEFVGNAAFCNVSRLEFFDSMDGKFIRGMLSGAKECEYTLLSSTDDSVVFRVWQPSCFLANSALDTKFGFSWRGDCSFDFSVLDAAYSSMKKPAKLHTAINRLAWPIDLDATTATKYERYISQNLEDTMDMLCDLKDAERATAVLGRIKLNGGKIEKLREIATKKRAKKVLRVLDIIAPSAPSGTGKKEPVKKKMTVLQTVTMVADALDGGDASKLAELEPIATKVRMTDRVDLLERAAASCDGEAIDRLYGLFAPFECVSFALLTSLFSGNISASKALVAHGADLGGKFVLIDELKASNGRELAHKTHLRECSYSHGLMNRSYRSGGAISQNLKEALTKYNGEVESRTKVTKCGEKLVVNAPSSEKAAKTLVAISGEAGFNESIAIRLLWNLISFDGRKTKDARFDAAAARIILKAGILSDEHVANLPWREAYDSLVGNYLPEYYYEAVKLIKDFAPAEEFPKCWRERFAKPGELSNEYEHMKTLLLFIDVLDADNCSNQMDVLRALTHEGKLKQLKKLAAEPGWFTKQRIKTLLEVAGDAGCTEITAWLLDLSGQGCKSTSPITLEL